MSRRILVAGRVQGVGFRWWVVRQAAALGLTGWVRNRCDGRVEILAAGAEAALDELAERCRRGPSGARVADVAIAEADEAAPARFEQRPTL